MSTPAALTCLWAAQRPGFPETRSPHWSCVLCSGWSLEPRTLVFHRRSRSSDHIWSSSQIQSPPEGEHLVTVMTGYKTHWVAEDCWSGQRSSSRHLTTSLITHIRPTTVHHRASPQAAGKLWVASSDPNFGFLPFVQKNIYHFNISVCVQHEVLRFQVSVQDPFTMKVIQGLCDAANTELGGGFVKIAPGTTTGV